MTPRDHNFKSYDGEIGMTFTGMMLSPARPQDYADIMKISRCRKCRFESFAAVAPTMPCHREDGIDISYLCDDLVLEDFTVDAGHCYAITIKQARNIFLLNGTILRPAFNWERVDIDLGNRSQYRRLRTEAVVIDGMRSQDGRPVRVRVGDSEKPTLRNGLYDVLTVQSLGLKGYVYTRALIDATCRREFELMRWENITAARYA